MSDLYFIDVEAQKFRLRYDDPRKRDRDFVFLKKWFRDLKQLTSEQITFKRVDVEGMKGIRRPEIRRDMEIVVEID